VALWLRRLQRDKQGSVTNKKAWQPINCLQKKTKSYILQGMQRFYKN
jgi:hypothetical protein